MLYIIRGLPGSGKTTVAGKLAPVVVEADLFMVDEGGEYKFDPKKLGSAHAQCQAVTEQLLSHRIAVSVAVANTFTRRWEYQPYIDMACRYDTPYQIITCVGDPSWVSIHNVPAATLARMKERWED
jgi:hypothetical protein